MLPFKQNVQNSQIHRDGRFMVVRGVSLEGVRERKADGSGVSSGVMKMF